jgi:DNA polymerase-1
VAAIKGASLVGLDCETTGLDARRDRLRLLQVAVEGRPPFVVDCFAIDPAPLFDVLARVELVGHNLAFDLSFLTILGFRPRRPIHDTMLLAQLLAAGASDRCGLADCCARELGIVLDKAGQKADWGGELSAEQLAYSAKDAAVLLPLYSALTARIDKAGLAETARIEERCLPALVWMGKHGVGFDRAAWEALADAAEKEAERLQRKLNRRAAARADGALWNWRSPKQVREVFSALGIDLTSTAVEALAAVDHPIARLLRRHRAASKQASTYGRAWLKHVDDDGRVRCDWRQLGA